jgi:alpha-1,4-digalacturonate transport system substrate-binding protein
MTVTAPIVNKTLFEQAGMPLPGPEATWDDWAAAVAKVAKATKTPFGMAWDRSGYPLSGALFNPVVDRLSQAINGLITLDQAYQRITSDVADAIAAAAKK